MLKLLKKERRNRMLIRRNIYFQEECPSVDRLKVDITPEVAKVLIQMIRDVAEAEPYPVYGKPTLNKFRDYSPDYYDSAIGEEETHFTQDLGRLCVNNDSVYWSCYEKHMDQEYESHPVYLATLEKIAAGEELTEDDLGGEDRNDGR